ncbi:MAG: metal-dependent hydrolase [Methanoregula sp.]
MLIFAHIFAGAVLGLVLARIIGDSRFIPVCIAGAILPDLIDKPLGYILLPHTLDSGTTIFHSFIIVVIAFIIALILLRFWHTLLGIAVACMLLLHQIMDEMWHVPVTWSFPLTGPFQPIHYANFFETYFWQEITTPYEWIFLFLIIVLLCEWYSDSYPDSLTSFNRRWRAPLLSVGLLFLCILGLYSLVCAGTGMGNIMAPYNGPESNLLLGLVALAGFGIIIKIPGMQSLQYKGSK